MPEETLASSCTFTLTVTCWSVQMAVTAGSRDSHKNMPYGAAIWTAATLPLIHSHQPIISIDLKNGQCIDTHTHTHTSGAQISVSNKCEWCLPMQNYLFFWHIYFSPYFLFYFDFRVKYDLCISLWDSLKRWHPCSRVAQKHPIITAKNQQQQRQQWVFPCEGEGGGQKEMWLSLSVCVCVSRPIPQCLQAAVMMDRPIGPLPQSNPRAPPPPPPHAASAHHTHDSKHWDEHNHQ